MGPAEELRRDQRSDPGRSRYRNGTADHALEIID